MLGHKICIVIHDCKPEYSFDGIYVHKIAVSAIVFTKKYIFQSVKGPLKSKFMAIKWLNSKFIGFWGEFVGLWGTFGS